jgi:hypothetical protein
MIVHCNEDKDCSYTDEQIREFGQVMTMPIPIGSDGISEIMALIEEHPSIPSNEWMEIMKRTQLPYY